MKKQDSHNANNDNKKDPFKTDKIFNFCFGSEDPEDIEELSCFDDFEMSIAEKRILATIIDPEPPLPYQLQPLYMKFGPPTNEYIIPDEDKEEVLQELYPFHPCPKLQDIRFDLHEEKYFKVADYKVIREKNRNFLVSPYYANSGGMVIDWMERDDLDCQVLMKGKN